MPLVYRRMIASDVDAVADLAEKGLRPGLYPSLTFDQSKVIALVDHFRNSVRDFHLVAFDGDRPVAAVAAAVQPLMFFERFEAVVVMCFSVCVGAGARLIGELMQWVRDNPAVRMVRWPQEFDVDPRMVKVISRRWGFNLQTANSVWLKA